jgi:hypothetical protein
MPFNAHWNSVTPPVQLESATFIDPVESTMIATFQGCTTPCMEAVACAAIGIVEIPNIFMKKVGTLAVSKTWTAFAGLGELPVKHFVPAGISKLRHFVVTVVVADTRLTLEFNFPLLPSYWPAMAVALSVDDVLYTFPAAANAAALAAFWS